MQIIFLAKENIMNFLWRGSKRRKTIFEMILCYFRFCKHFAKEKKSEVVEIKIYGRNRKKVKIRKSANGFVFFIFI